MTNYLNLIDRNTTGARYDVTPLFGDAAAFSRLLDDLVDQVSGIEFNRVAAVDALGFILGTGISLRLQKGLIVIRKGGKLPVQADVQHFVDYTGQRKSLEIRTDAVARGTRVLVVDEWVETGAQVRAAISLIEGRGGAVVAVASINIDEQAGAALREDGPPCFDVSRR